MRKAPWGNQVFLLKEAKLILNKIMDQLKISTVTPVYRGADTLRALVSELRLLREYWIATNSPVQLIESVFVDDGSQDGSAEELIKLAAEHNWVHVVTLSRNFGQHPATIAGLLYTSGDWVVTLDEDLQHQPKYIIDLLLQASGNQSDIIYAHPEKSVHEAAVRDLTSKYFKLFISRLSGNKYIPLFNSFRLIRGSIARAASAVSSDQTYFDIALSWFTTRIHTKVLPLKDERYIKTGGSGYSLSSLLSHAGRLLQSSSIKYLRFGALTGIVVMVITMLAGLVVLVIKFFYPELILAQGWVSVFLATLFFGGLNAFLIGFVLENVSILLIRSHGKPKFFEVDRSSDQILRDWCNNPNIESYDHFRSLQK